MLDLATKYLQERQLPQALSLTREVLTEQPEHAEGLLLLSKCLLAAGDIRGAEQALTKATPLFSASPGQLGEHQKAVHKQVSTLEEALHQIREGQHVSDQIQFVKNSVSSMLGTGLYAEALSMLRELTEARKAKTTNILWIGNYLKDLYFAEGALYLRQAFEKFLLDEIIFYYLKACKLYEPGYQLIREEIKKHQ